jgi:uncharacterized protein
MADSAQSYVEPRAAWSLTLAGKDLADKINPRLISLRLTEKRGEESDTLEIALHDHDGQLALPPEGALLDLAFGWDRGTGIQTGLVSKGSFKVDELTWSGPPDTVTITARAADLAGSFRTRKTRIWKNTTLGAVIAKIAGEHGHTPRCHADLAGKALTTAEQAGKSDMTFLRDLGRRYDAVATIKAGALIFAPVDAETTATVTRQKGDRYEYRRSAREGREDGAEADWHDAHAATRKKVTKGGTRRRKLKRVYSSQGDADAASQAESNRLKRAAATFTITLAHGDAALAPGMKLKAQGFKTEVDAKSWRIASVDHDMNGTGGFTTSLEMEVAA